MQTALICYALPKFRKWYVISAASILAIIPDAGRLFQSNPNDWTKFYRWAHTSWYCFLIPFWNLHIAEDYFIHQPAGGWYWWAYYAEILLWMLESILIFILVKQSKRSG